MALLALAVGRQTAGRVMPAGCAMREADFEVLLRLVERLGGEQRAALGRALASVSGSGQSGTVGVALLHPFVVKVTDVFGNAVSGTTVSFTGPATASVSARRLSVE